MFFQRTRGPWSSQVPQLLWIPVFHQEPIQHDSCNFLQHYRGILVSWRYFQDRLRHAMDFLARCFRGHNHIQPKDYKCSHKWNVFVKVEDTHQNWSLNSYHQHSLQLSHPGTFKHNYCNFRSDGSQRCIYQCETQLYPFLLSNLIELVPTHHQELTQRTWVHFFQVLQPSSWTQGFTLSFVSQISLLH